MLNVLVAGVGGQGSVLASKILAQAAQARGWQVRTAETIGMAQRGGNVLGHVRMGNHGEQVHAPLVPKATADCIIALEPGEALRAMPYLAPEGLLATSTVGIPSVATNLSGQPYDVDAILQALQQRAAHFVAVDTQAVCRQVGSSKVLNVAMLAAAVKASVDAGSALGQAIDLAQLKDALAACVKLQFLNMNLAAIDAVAC